MIITSEVQQKLNASSNVSFHRQPTATTTTSSTASSTMTAAQVRSLLLPFVAQGSSGLATMDDASLSLAAIKTLWMVHGASFASPLDVLQLAIVICQRSTQSLLRVSPPPPSSLQANRNSSAHSSVVEEDASLCNQAGGGGDATKAVWFFMQGCVEVFRAVLAPPSSSSQCTKPRATQLAAAFWTTAVTVSHHVVLQCISNVWCGDGVAAGEAAYLKWHVEQFIEVVSHIEEESSAFSVAVNYALVQVQRCTALILAWNDGYHADNVVVTVTEKKNCNVKDDVLGALQKLCRFLTATSTTSHHKTSSGATITTTPPHPQLARIVTADSKNEPHRLLLRKLLHALVAKLLHTWNTRATTTTAQQKQQPLGEASWRRDVNALARLLPLSLRPSSITDVRAAADGGTASSITASLAEMSAWVARVQVTDSRHMQRHRESFLHGVPWASSEGATTTEAVAAALDLSSSGSDRTINTEKSSSTSTSHTGHDDVWSTLISCWGLAEDTQGSSADAVAYNNSGNVSNDMDSIMETCWWWRRPCTTTSLPVVAPPTTAPPRGGVVEQQRRFDEERFVLPRMLLRAAQEQLYCRESSCPTRVSTTTSFQALRSVARAALGALSGLCTAEPSCCSSSSHGSSRPPPDVGQLGSLIDVAMSLVWDVVLTLTHYQYSYSATNPTTTSTMAECHPCAAEKAQCRDGEGQHLPLPNEAHAIVLDCLSMLTLHCNDMKDLVGPPSEVRQRVLQCNRDIARFVQVVDMHRSGLQTREVMWEWWMTIAPKAPVSSLPQAGPALFGSYSATCCSIPDSLSTQMFTAALALIDMGSTTWSLDMSLPIVLRYAAAASPGVATATLRPLLSSPISVALLAYLTAEVVHALCLDGDILLARSLMWLPLHLVCIGGPLAVALAPLPLMTSVIATVSHHAARHVTGNAPANNSEHEEGEGRRLLPGCRACGDASTASRDALGYLSFEVVATLTVPHAMRLHLSLAAGDDHHSHQSSAVAHMAWASKCFRALIAVNPCSSGGGGMVGPAASASSERLLSSRSMSLQQLGEAIAASTLLQRIDGDPRQRDNEGKADGIAMDAVVGCSKVLAMEDIVSYAASRYATLGRTFDTRRRLCAALTVGMPQNQTQPQSPTTKQLTAETIRQGPLITVRVDLSMQSPTGIHNHHEHHHHQATRLDVKIRHTAPRWLWSYGHPPPSNTEWMLENNAEEEVELNVDVTTTSSLYHNNSRNTAETSISVASLLQRMQDVFEANKASLFHSTTSPDEPSTTTSVVVVDKERRRAIKTSWWEKRTALDAAIREIASDLDTTCGMTRRWAYAALPLPHTTTLEGVTMLMKIHEAATRMYDCVIAAQREETEEWFGSLRCTTMLFQRCILLCNWLLWNLLSCSPDSVKQWDLPNKSAFVAAALFDAMDDDDDNEEVRATRCSPQRDEVEAHQQKSVFASCIEAALQHLQVYVVESAKQQHEGHGLRPAVRLLLSNELHSLPWEGLPLFHNVGCVRVPVSTQNGPRSVRADVDVRDPLHYGTSTTTRCYYVCNPAGDLTRTEDWFQRNVLHRMSDDDDDHQDSRNKDRAEEQRRIAQWRGTCGLQIASSAIQWANLVTAFDAPPPPSHTMDRTSPIRRDVDLFLFMGHGGAEGIAPRQYLYDVLPPHIHDDAQRRRRVPRFALLMGCCSAKLVASPRHFDCVGTPMAWLHAGAEAVVGPTMHVGDGDIDRVTGALLTHLQLMGGDRQQQESGKGSLPHLINNTNSAAMRGGCFDRRDRITTDELAYALCSARRQCKLPFLTGAITVCYAV